MNIREIVGELPPESHVRRLVETCLDDLKIPEYELESVVVRTKSILDGLHTLEHEGRLARGEYMKEAEERLIEHAARMHEIREGLARIAASLNKAS